MLKDSARENCILAEFYRKSIHAATDMEDSYISYILGAAAFIVCQ